MSGLPKGVDREAAAPHAPRHQDRTYLTTSTTSRQFPESSPFLGNHPAKNSASPARNLRDSSLNPLELSAQLVLSVLVRAVSQPYGGTHEPGPRHRHAAHAQRGPITAPLRRDFRRDDQRRPQRLVGQTYRLASAGPRRRRPVRACPPTRCRI